jgi:hypothetical protein
MNPSPINPTIRPLVDICQIVQQKIREGNAVAVKEYYNLLWLHMEISPPIRNKHTDFLIQTTCDKVKEYLNKQAEPWKM